VSGIAGVFEQQFKNVLGHFATGVAVVTAIDGVEPVGLTIQSFCSLSLDPPLILLCPARASTSWPRVERAGRLCVNLLAEGQAALARQFARSGGDKYTDVTWTRSAETGSPLLEGALAWVDCEIEQSFQGGDHLIAVCRVLDLAVRTDLKPLIFYRSNFLPDGHAPSTAPQMRSSRPVEDASKGSA
jgi:3-hydroxy-9,10-secoandrosta-1,3,5(10)-triene-9,17-dione monooxygenase reductase component